MKEYTLRVGDAAKLLSVTTQAVRDMVRTGQLSYEVRRVGLSGKTRYWFNQEEVEALARSRRGQDEV